MPYREKSVLGIDEHGEGIRADDGSVGQGDRIGIPRCITSQLWLVQRKTCKTREAFSERWSTNDVACQQPFTGRQFEYN